MRSDSRDLRFLENAFSILRFRRRGVVSFRRFVVLAGRPAQTAHEVHADATTTQPLRGMIAVAASP